MAGLQPRVCGGQVTVALRGELDITGAADAAAAVAACGSLGQRGIVDLASLDFIDCSALRALAGARLLARQDGGDVLLAAPHGLALRLPVLTGLNQVFDIYASVAAASAVGPEQAAAAAATG